MKISAITLKSPKDGIKEFSGCPLGDVVVLTGGNGAGKTRLLKLIEKYINGLRLGRDDETIEIRISEHDEEEEVLGVNNVEQIKVINYSHYDAQLQSPKEFTPYVICNAKKILETCDYEETALNSLLMLYDMVKGYSEEFKDGKQFVSFQAELQDKFNIELTVDMTDEREELKIFNQKIEKAALSPGQQYLLRMAVACYRNRANKNMIFFLDEPELHLHPKALIDIVKHLRSTFQECQFWISTHSLPLIAYLTESEKNTTVLHLEHGNVKRFRSDSEGLIEGLMGAASNRKAIQSILAMPDEYACNRFSIECFDKAVTEYAKPKDPQTQMVATILSKGDLVVDYGAGKGRFFEGLGLDYQQKKLSEEINYYAYDHEKKDAEKCKHVMEKFGSSSSNYYNDIVALKERVSGKADFILLVNVLHEIETIYWTEIFQNIEAMLKETGRLIIVERSELTVGEAPYNNCFLMLTKESANALFGRENVEYLEHPEKPYIVKYGVSKQGLQVTDDKVQACIKQIKQDSFEMIKQLKGTEITEERYKRGLKIAFWLHQYANASLMVEEV